MYLLSQLTLAVLLDFLLGDPRWLPHPVGGIAKLCAWLETLTRRRFADAREAGFVTTTAVVATMALLTLALLTLAARVHPALGFALGTWMIYSAIATRDLVRHSLAVDKALQRHDLVAARRRVGWIVGRDTAKLDEAGVIRAAVESVAESTVDGTTAALFYAAIFGPAGAMVYRAINTMDSLFGYKNAKYAEFGWAPARLDDLANYLPARLTAAVFCLAARVCGHSLRRTLRILRRDARKHASPNSGFAEAAMAGALGVRLGGVNSYGGKPVTKPYIGDAVNALDRQHIAQANRVVMVTVVIFLVAIIAARLLLSQALAGAVISSIGQ